ncbi:hypothetical protein DL96DRAFT_1563413 [Flagelloscypha sp. PMI_526]|nr:hypothetical protein DL96DRAFT_1563413 [Flagelloscypha sp. PMI_526]
MSAPRNKGVDDVDFIAGVRSLWDEYISFLAARKLKGIVSTQYLSEFTSSKTILKKFDTGQDGRTTILTERADNSYKPTFYILGFVTAFNLGPVNKTSGSNPRRWYQSITITGLDDAEFAKGLEGLAHLSDFVIASAARNDAFRPSPKFAHGYPTFHAQTRVLTSSVHNTSRSVNVPTYLDPEGLIAESLLTQQFSYTEDNHISIKTMVEGDNTGQIYRFTSVNSGLHGIHVGSLVELGVSLRVIPIKSQSDQSGNPDKLQITRLESILVVNGEGKYEIQKAARLRRHAAKRHGQDLPAPNPKRKRNLHDEDVSTTVEMREEYS